MKQFLLALLILGGLTTNAQIGYRQLQISGGLSASNSKIFSVQLERAGTRRIHAGMLFQTLLYSKHKPLHFSIPWNMTFQSIGAYIKSNVYTAKNFCATWFVGGAAGTDTHVVIVYPFGGFEQGWYIRPKTQIFISEGVLYLRNVDLKNLWQPNLQVGFKSAL